MLQYDAYLTTHVCPVPWYLDWYVTIQDRELILYDLHSSSTAILEDMGTWPEQGVNNTSCFSLPVY